MAEKSLPVIHTACSRRAFFEALGFAAAAGAELSACTTNAAGTAVTQSCGASTCIDLTNPANAALMSVGGALAFDTATDTVIVVRVSTTTVIALSAICTHAGCEVEYDGTAQIMACPCHGSEFGTDGHVIRGPAGAPLRSYPAMLANNTITIAT